MKEKIAMPVPYEDRTVKYKLTDERQYHEKSDIEEVVTHGKTNQLTWDLMKNRYVVLRKFIPQEILDFVNNTWETSERALGHGRIMLHEKEDITWKNPESSIGKSSGGYCTPWGVALHDYIHKKLDDYIDMELRMTYSFSRKYVRGAYLASHTDRPSCEISGTLCTKYTTDDGTPWPIWIRADRNFVGGFEEDYDYVQEVTQKIPVRKRAENNCHKVLLEPGDLMLYQGPNAPHWRDFLIGEESYHVFVHFYNANTNMRKIPSFIMSDKTQIEGKIRGESPTNYSLSVLEHDGRNSMYQPDGERRDDFTAFTNEYESLKFHKEDGQPVLNLLVNNYDNMELVEE